MLGETGKSARSFTIILIVHLAVILFWQFAVDVFQVPKFILPSPLAALRTLAYRQLRLGLEHAGHIGRNPRRLLRSARPSALRWRWSSPGRAWSR